MKRGFFSSCSMYFVLQNTWQSRKWGSAESDPVVISVLTHRCWCGSFPYHVNFNGIVRLVRFRLRRGDFLGSGLTCRCSPPRRSDGVKLVRSSDIAEQALSAQRLPNSATPILGLPICRPGDTPGTSQPAATNTNTWGSDGVAGSVRLRN